MIYAKDYLQSPVELYSVGLDGSGEKAITGINAKKVAAAEMGESEQFTFAGADDHLGLICMT